MRIALITLLLLCLGLGCGKKEVVESAGNAPVTPKTEPGGKPPSRPSPMPVHFGLASKRSIDNPIVEKAVRKAAEKPTGELTKADLEKVTELHFLSKQLTDVKGLENLTQLTWLDLAGNKLTEVKGLENLKKLYYLNLRYNKLTDVKGLEKLTQLTYLNLYNNQLTDVKGLENLTQLKVLYLFNNPDLTKAQIDELKKALPKCKFY